jgi:hypothetical protein
MINKILGYYAIITYRSADSKGIDILNNCILPDEFLNGVNPSGVPPHEITLKVGIPIILIRTVDIAQGYTVTLCINVS